MYLLDTPVPMAPVQPSANTAGNASLWYSDQLYHDILISASLWFPGQHSQPCVDVAAGDGGQQAARRVPHQEPLPVPAQARRSLLNTRPVPVDPSCEAKERSCWLLYAGHRWNLSFAVGRVPPSDGLPVGLTRLCLPVGLTRLCCGPHRGEVKKANRRPSWRSPLQAVPFLPFSLLDRRHTFCNSVCSHRLM